MMNTTPIQMSLTAAIAALPCALASAVMAESASPAPITLTWEKNMLVVHAPHIPGKTIEINYLEAYCRAGSQTADWSKHTVIPHETELVDARADGTRIKLRCTVSDGVVVDHTITAGTDEIDFHITARNPTDKASEIHWAQPCMRVGEFTGTGAKTTADKYAYIKKCFIFLDDESRPALMPTRDWATKARYIPGQVWAGPGVPRADVNPRPLHPDVPANGLIACFSGDGKMILAMAFAPYQELFQGVIRCIHSDFRIGGLDPGETKSIHGKIYLVPNDIPALLRRYGKDFPDKVTKGE